jgi:outer membrane protein assembly factor BamB
MKKGKAYFFVFFLLLIVGAIVYFLHDNRKYAKSDSFKGVPVNSSIIIHVPSFSSFFSFINNDTGFRDEFKTFDLTSTVYETALTLDSLDVFKTAAFQAIYQKQGYISFVNQGKDDLEILLVAGLDNKAEERSLIEWIKGLKEYGCTVKSQKYDSAVIFSIQKVGSEKSFYVSVFNGLIVGSYSNILVENSIRQVQTGISLVSEPSFVKLQKTSNNRSFANLYVNFSTLTPMLKKVLRRGQKVPAFFDKKEAVWAELDIDIKSKDMVMNGFVLGDKNSLITELLAGMRTRESKIEEVLPSNIGMFIALNPESAVELHNRLMSYLRENNMELKYRNELTEIKKQYKVDIDKELFSFLENEMALAFTNVGPQNTVDGSILVLETKGMSFTLDKMKGLLTALNVPVTPVKDYKIDKETSFPIYRGLPGKMLEHVMEWFFPQVPHKYFILYDNYIVFSDSIDLLQEFLYSNVLKKTLANQKSYSDFKDNFSARDNFFMYAEVSDLVKLLRTVLKKDYLDLSSKQTETLSRFFAAGLQIASTGNMLYANIYVDYDPVRENEPETIWQSLLDSTVINKPVLVRNHYTGEKEVIVQDAKFNLYLINNSGRLLWKKPLDGRILGSIYQIDLYRNNKLQYIFNTENKIYLLDRNGNFVENYPIALPSKATNGLSVIDYENNRDYRIFLATSDRRVRLFDKRGNSVTGWGFKRTEGVVKQPVRHFRSNSKDYIVFSDNHKLYILNRRGNVRVKPEKHVHAAANCDIFIEGKNTPYCRLVTASPDAGIVYVELPSGKTRIVKMKGENRVFGFSHFVQSGKPGYVFIMPDEFMILNSDGKKISGRTFDKEMDLTIDKYRFSSNDIKFGVHGKNDNHIYLLNSDGSIYKGFPLIGNSRFSIGFLKTSSKFNLVVGGENNYIYNYRVD